jgi:hypothetical protein
MRSLMRRGHEVGPPQVRLAIPVEVDVEEVDVGIGGGPALVTWNLFGWPVVRSKSSER